MLSYIQLPPRLAFASLHDPPSLSTSSSFDRAFPPIPQGEGGASFPWLSPVKPKKEKWAGGGKKNEETELGEE